MEGRRRLTLLEQMSASTNGRALAGLSLHDVLTPPIPLPPISSRTLLDIIRDEEPKSYKALIGNKDTNKPWKSFKDRLRLKKAGATWSSSDIPLPRHHIRSRRNSVRYVTPTTMSNESLPADNRPPQSTNPTFNRRSSVRLLPAAIDEVESPRRRLETALSEERALSAREAVAAQEAAEAEAAKAKEEEEGGGGGGSESAAVTAAEPVRMSLMDLLEETDREMGLEGGRYTMDDDEDEEEEEEEEEEEQAVEVEAAAAAATMAVDGDVEYSCCVCMVRHKGAAFIPCGHTFCRMCSRELFVQRGNCPLCNNFILEILDIF